MLVKGEFMNIPYQAKKNDRGLLILVTLAIIAIIVIAFLTFSYPNIFIGFEKINIESIGVIKIQGTLADSQGFTILGSTVGVQQYVNLVEQAIKDRSIKAVLLYVNSPGGTVSASEKLFYEIEKLAHKKTVVAYVEGYGASGAYMIMLPSRKIIASESSLVGSIGVYSVIMNYKGLLDKLGIKVYTFKSGRLKDVGSPYRNMSAEDKRIYSSIIQEFFSVFKNRVLKYRNITDQEVFTGRPYTSKEAKKVGLIDDIGTYDYAINVTKRLAGLPLDAPVRVLTPPKPSLLDLLFRLYFHPSTKVMPSYKILAMWPPPVIQP